jgi:hypothetical protein
MDPVFISLALLYLLFEPLSFLQMSQSSILDPGIAIPSNFDLIFRGIAISSNFNLIIR